MGECLLCSRSVEATSSLENGTLRCALWKVLQYWGLLAKYQNDQNKEFALLWQSRDFCPDCIALLEEIAKIHYKLIALELHIQEKVERLGRAVVERERADAGDGTLASTQNTSHVCDETEMDAWNRLRTSVSQSKV
jgi:hypothetical protein